MRKRSLEIAGEDRRLAAFAAAREQVREQRLQHGEALRRHRPCGPLGAVVDVGCRRLLGERRRLAAVRLLHGAERARDLAPQRRRLDRHGAPVLAQHPRGEQRDRRVLGDEDVVLETTGLAVGALDPPGGVARDLDPRLAGDVADLPRRPAAVLLDVEVGGRAEVALAPRGEANVAADARDAELLPALVVEVLADDVPDAVVGQKRERVHRPLGERVARDRVVRELDRPLLRDRALELRQPAGHLDGVVGVADLDADGGLRRQLAEAGPAEREVLQREPQRLRVGELAVEEKERRLERGELLVAELELREEVLLRAQRVELLAGELVPLRVERHAEPDELRAVRVEAARERLVRHLGVALDVRLDVAGRERPPLRHQEGDERELPDQLVGVVAHSDEPSRSPLWKGRSCGLVTAKCGIWRCR